MRRFIQTAVGILIASAGLYIFFRGTDIAELGARLKHTNPFLLGLSLVMMYPTLIFRAIRWRLILPVIPGTHKRNLLSHTAIAFMINNIVPARAGEAARVVLLWKKNGYPLAVSAGSLIIDRFIDVLIFLPMFAVPVFTLPCLHHLLFAAWISLALFAAGILIIVLSGRHPLFFQRCIGRLGRFLPKRFHTRITIIAREISSVMDWTQNVPRAAGVVVSSICVWLCIIIPVTLLAGNYPAFGIRHGAFVVSFAVVGAAIPLAPGYVGTLHAAVLQSLKILGFGLDAARALAVLMHAASYVPLTLIGFIYLLKADISIRDITRAGKTMQKKEKL